MVFADALLPIDYFFAAQTSSLVCSSPPISQRFQLEAPAALGRSAALRAACP